MVHIYRYMAMCIINQPHFTSCIYQCFEHSSGNLQGCSLVTAEQGYSGGVVHLCMKSFHQFIYSFFHHFCVRMLYIIIHMSMRVTNTKDYSTCLHCINTLHTIMGDIGRVLHRMLQFTGQSEREYRPL